jgi:hypothetical protein
MPLGAVHPIWFTPEAIEAWRAEPRTGRGGQPSYSALAIATALTLRAVFRLALRQTEGLVGSVLRLLGLDLPVPDHSTLSRRAETLEVARPKAGSAPCTCWWTAPASASAAPGEWLAEKHGTRRRRAWRVLTSPTDADTGRIVASAPDRQGRRRRLAGRPPARPDRGSVASFTGDGAYDRDDVYAAVAARHPEAAVIVPPRSSAVPSEHGETAPTRRDVHLRCLVAWVGGVGALSPTRVPGHAMRTYSGRPRSSIA